LLGHAVPLYECGMRMRSQGDAKLLIITWVADVL
jgi:hypothetical protein